MSTSEELERNQELIPYYREKWLDICLNTDAADLDMAVPAIHYAYRAYDLEPPDHYFICPSPLSFVVFGLSLLIIEHINRKINP